MSQTFHHFSELFAQLGLPSDDQGIRDFLTSHSPLAHDIPLPDAPFWNAAQAAFLREGLLQDADWAEMIDQLNIALRTA
ncbi:DUF2789 domain-containing protein [Methylobacillus gramineus]|uniref:DUF2789 domain-containing protein n=1 Tax=Methylobacillus gramineus TaxID=755169 RepID=UPI001CFFC786|nr:DUF2789 domain-containing protein [Methylobacillus gramineus]MCB5185769.1 DUF2789 domain-containing protein [Methylobacillus gramineus]